MVVAAALRRVHLHQLAATVRQAVSAMALSTATTTTDFRTTSPEQ